MNSNQNFDLDGLVIKPIVAPTIQLTLDEIRHRRNILLAQSDYTQMTDWPGNKDAWAVYRQALRDVTNVANPEDVVWPTPPEE